LNARPSPLKPIAKIVSVDAARPEADIVGQAVQAIRGGGVVVMPTSGLYGLGSDASDPQAVERIFAIKGREPGKPILVLIDTRDMLATVTRQVSPAAHALMDRFWPGKVTFVLWAAPGLPEGITGGSGKVGVRQVLHPVAAALVRALKRPLTGTSANLAGAGGCADVAHLAPVIIDGVDMVLDAGTLAGGAGSTVVDVTGKTPVLLREGAVTFEEILNAHAALVGRDGS